MIFHLDDFSFFCLHCFVPHPHPSALLLTYHHLQPSAPSEAWFYELLSHAAPGKSADSLRISKHLESCTPGQDWEKWYVLVCTSTYQYKTVQVSTRIPNLYIQVCTSTYRYVLLRSQVVF
jgi:hypothetical protein